MGDRPSPRLDLIPVAKIAFLQRASVGRDEAEEVLHDADRLGRGIPRAEEDPGLASVHALGEVDHVGGRREELVALFVGRLVAKRTAAKEVDRPRSKDLVVSMDEIAALFPRTIFRPAQRT